MTGASNFLGTKPPLDRVRQIATHSGYQRPENLDGPAGRWSWSTPPSSHPTNPIDVAELDVDYLAFSFHKVLAPFGVGILYARETLLERSLPFLYGGDMIAEGKVTLGHVEYNQLPWKYVAGTPNVLGVIASAQALRLLVDLALDPPEPWFGNPQPLPRTDVVSAMTLVQQHVRGPHRPRPGPGPQHPRPTGLRTPARASRGHRCWRSTSAARTPERSQTPWTAAASKPAPAATAPPWPTSTSGSPASCRLSFAAYTNPHDVDRALDALERVVR